MILDQASFIFGVMVGALIVTAVCFAALWLTRDIGTRP